MKCFIYCGDNFGHLHEVELSRRHIEMVDLAHALLREEEA